MDHEQITVQYVRHSGDDLSVVDAARVSYAAESGALGWTGVEDGPMIPELHDRDKKLIRYLADHKHYSPFNHAFVTFRCTAPLFAMAQLKKSEYMPWNEISRRYVDSEPEFYWPNEWRGRPRKGNSKQGSEGHITISDDIIEDSYDGAMLSYRTLLEVGVAPEMARMVLPQSMLSSWIWSGSLKAISKMCSLRCASDTQYESRVVANQISDIMRGLFPVSWAALMGEAYPYIRPMSDDERQRAKEKAA